MTVQERMNFTSQIKTIVDGLDDEYLKDCLILVNSCRLGQEQHTPEYLAQKEAQEKIERARKHKEFLESLQRPGFILVGWVHCSFEYHLNQYLVLYMPTTGPRWVHMTYAWDDKKLALNKPFCNRRFGKGYYRQRFEEEANAATETDFGIRYEAFALHLLNDGPDRRAAYVRRCEEGKL